jgi:hypothetical protein
MAAAMSVAETTRYELPEGGTSLLGYIVRRMHKTALLESALGHLARDRRPEALLDVALYAAASSTSFGPAYYQPSFNNPGDELSEADPATGAVVTATLVGRSPHYDIRYQVRMDRASFQGRETILGTTVGIRGLGMPAPSHFEFATTDGGYVARISGTVTSELVPGLLRRTRIRAYGTLDFSDSAGHQGRLTIDRSGCVHASLAADGKTFERRLDLHTMPSEATWVASGPGGSR